MKEFGILNFFPFSACGILIFVVEVCFERQLCSWQRARVGWVGEPCSPSALPVGFSLLAAAFSARLKEHLLWQVSGTDFFPAGFLRKFSKTPVWAEPSHVMSLAGANTHVCPGRGTTV